MASNGTRKILKQPHHIQQELCISRAPYRQGRQLTAVKVYTVNHESNHLLIYGIPQIELHEEVTRLCRRYGEIKPVEYVNYEDKEEFTDVFHVTYKRIQSARFAKKQIDTKNFYGNVLHVFYAPELETISETRNKLITRRKEVALRTKKLAVEKSDEKVTHKSKEEDNEKEVYPTFLLDSEPTTCSYVPLHNQPSPSTSAEINTLAANTRSDTYDHYSIPGQSHNGKPYSVAKINQPEPIADFYKIYNSSTSQPAIGPIIPEKLINLEQVDRLDPYKVDAPFVKHKKTYEVPADPESRFSNRTIVKKKHSNDVMFQPPIKKTWSLDKPQSIQTDVSRSNKLVVNQTQNESLPLNIGNNNLTRSVTPSSKTITTKFKFIPRQVKPKNNNLKDLI
uniref:RNA-binding protein 48 n=1 Tax=Cacopsylla melanoneura TaxID=428564 RepID=A0A8D8V813_9HEMI